MKTTATRIALGAIRAATAATTHAAALETDRFYAGVGVSTNDLDGEDATGRQIFAGYELPLDLGRADTAIEIGFHDAGDFDPDPDDRFDDDKGIEGVWATGVATLPVADRVDLIGRFGADFGDDDGLMAGGGVGFDLNERIELRGEYVIRDRTDSLQANLLYRF